MTETCETISRLLLHYFLNNNTESFLFKPAFEIDTKVLLNHAEKLIEDLELDDYIDITLRSVIIGISGMSTGQQEAEMAYFSVKKDKEYMADTILGWLYIKLGINND